MGEREREETRERFTVTHPDRSAGKLGGRVGMFRFRDGGKKLENAHVRHNKRKKKKSNVLWRETAEVSVKDGVRGAKQS